MKNVFRLILSAHIAAFGIQLATDTAEAQVLRPGDDAIITPGGRTIVNPPLHNPRPTARSTWNPDGSTTYPRGTTPPRTDGFTQANRDGSVTIFPRESAPARDQEDAPEGLDLRLPYSFSDRLQLRARYNYQPENGAEDDWSVEPPTIEFLDDAESPPAKSSIPESGEGDGEVILRYYLRDRFDGGMTRVDPPTLLLDDDVEPPVESVIPELQGNRSDPHDPHDLSDNTSISIADDGGVGELAPASKKSWDEVWAEFFGRKIPDPLAPAETEEYQNNKEEFDRRTQAAAEFTQAATSVVTAGVPSPSAASSAGSVAVSEAVDGVVDGETSEEPGFLGQVWNELSSAASWVGSLFD